MKSILILLFVLGISVLGMNSAFADEITIPITQGSDDAEEGHSGNSEKIKLYSSDLDLVDKNIGLRFNQVEIPQGTIITNAYLEFTSQDDKHYSTPNVVIYGHAIDNSPTFTTNYGDISNRDVTFSHVYWGISGWSYNESGVDTQTPSITSIIQEIIDRPNWNNGNSLSIIIKKQIVSHGGSDDRDAYSFERDSSKSAKLHITYSISEPIPEPPIEEIPMCTNSGYFVNINVNKLVYALNEDIIINGFMLSSSTPNVLTVSIASDYETMYYEVLDIPIIRDNDTRGHFNYTHSPLGVGEYSIFVNSNGQLNYVAFSVVDES